MKFNKTSKVLTDAINSKVLLESKFNSDNLNDKRSLSLIRYTHKADNIYSYEWTNFRNIEQFGSFVINSKKFSILEYILRWDHDLQNIPRIQSFMKAHKNQPKESCYRPNSKSTSVTARPLLLILQEAYWKSLMESYFKYFHPCRPLFNLVNFNPKTASESLLSAIYFAGFIIQPNPPDEIYSYMQSYAICNIKKILFKVSLSNAQALGIYSYAFYLSGNSSLSRVCLAQFGRICHVLGISIDRKKLPILDQYNRKLAFNNVKLYYKWEKLGTPPYGLISQDDEFDLDVYEPAYQLPNSSLNLYNNNYENIAYSIFCCQFAKLSNLCVIINTKCRKYDYIQAKIAIEELNIKTNEIYYNAKSSLENIINLIPDHKINITVYLHLVKCSYIICILCIYSKMLEISNNRNLSIVQAIVDIGIELWDLISNNTYLINVWSWGPYIISFHLIQVYSLCTPNQQRAKDLITIQ
ncbi:hypothetical protein CONCODRAFT_13672 [Conidiobolus coronatus NRRL 28638]|uniref:Transcription factor domain-containing protein n=1 Tax=Conidiobolus coronatus (strain ATCC 28846 / CBS 209.66 / NRRL 28638) TaxID=796925 RepID=A0A137NQ99_CONC2|nr:hypothetical protein CONCODRAFT_13672 [Conidiobolus coronatus NRRL 28638]|eukprot:KXN64933.1 hypothetical protein CONCODRAFT_13672 [Conidiobolus coronatus NRRL 28638]